MANETVFNSVTPVAISNLQDGEVLIWDATAAVWENAAAPAGLGDVTASGTLTNNVPIVGAGGAVIKATTSPNLGTPTATKIGIGVVTPENSSILQVKESGASAVTAGFPAQVLISLTDENSFSALAILNTAYSADTDDAFSISQVDAGGVYISVGPAYMFMEPADGTVLFPRTISAAALAGTDLFFMEITATDAATPTTFIGSAVAGDVRYGPGAEAVKGTAHAISANFVVTGNVHADNEHAVFAGTMRYDIGTGYTQSTGPSGKAWFTDFQCIGPIAVQPETLNGITMVVQNNYNGSPNATPSAGMWIVSENGFGDATHQAATSYPVDVGLGIVGLNSSSALGFTTGIQVGGAGSPWAVAASKVGTGIHIRDYTTHAIKIDNPSGSPTASIEADGLIKGHTLQPSSAYKSVDGSTGASSTGAYTLITSITVKNGLVTAITGS